MQHPDTKVTHHPGSRLPGVVLRDALHAGVHHVSCGNHQGLPSSQVTRDASSAGGISRSSFSRPAERADLDLYASLTDQQCR